jgi:hypothetical protein
VRLDHLLSKEHLIGKPIQEPTVRECRTGVLEGGDTGQSGPATAGLLVQPASVGVERGLVRLESWRANMHPVGYLKEQPSRCVGPRLFFHARQDSDGIPVAVSGVGVVGEGFGLVVG